MENPSNRQLYEGDKLVRFDTDQEVCADDFGHEKNVIFIHGLTSHGIYMEPCVRQFNTLGWRSYLFNYNSYRGIREAANSLYTMLREIDRLGDGVISKHRITLICHSMGGLVARAFCYFPGASDFLLKVVTLGTPHNGTLGNWDLLKYMVKWAEEQMHRPLIGFRKSCKSAKEVLGIDEESLLQQLQRSNGHSVQVPFLSISGGRNQLDFRNEIYASLVNLKLQKLLEKPNDGLVSERSASVMNLPTNQCMPQRVHFKDYPEYLEINHTNLVKNQTLGLKMHAWLNGYDLSPQTAPTLGGGGENVHWAEGDTSAGSLTTVPESI